MHVLTFDEEGMVWEWEVNILQPLVLSWPPQTLTSITRSCHLSFDN